MMDKEAYLEHLNSEVKKTQKEILDAKIQVLKEKCDGINSKIHHINQKLIPLQKNKDTLTKEYEIVKKEIMVICQHKYRKITSFDGHRNNHEYKCTLCDFRDNQNRDFEVVEYESWD